MGWLVDRRETETETVFVYRRAWLIYVMLAPTLLLMLVSNLEIPGAMVMRGIGAVMFAVWLPAMAWFTLHFRRWNRGGATFTGHKLSRSNPLTLRVPKSDERSGRP